LSRAVTPRRPPQRRTANETTRTNKGTMLTADAGRNYDVVWLRVSPLCTEFPSFPTH
jgi:hypothetical protein